MAIETISEQRCFGGIQGFYKHASSETNGTMKFGVFKPPQAAKRKVPVLYYLAGLTCTEETFAIKAGAQRVAAELGLMLVTPDTSPRDTGIEGATGDWEFGEAAGFYLDATTPAFAKRFRMLSYVTKELPKIIGRELRGRRRAREHLRSLDGRPRRAHDRAQESGSLQVGVGIRADHCAERSAVGSEGAAAVSRRR